MTAQANPAVPAAYAARRFTPRIEALLAERYRLTRNEGDQVLPPAELAKAAKGADYLVVSVTDRVDRAVIEALLPELKVIATLSVGTDHIDLAAAREHGLAVLTTPDVLSAACADLALMLILAAMRNAGEGERMVRADAWPGWAPTQLLGKGMAGRKLGIFGMGRIGREVAKRARGFDVELHYHNRSRLSPDLEDGAIYHADVDSLLAVSEIFCFCAPGGGALANFLDADRIAKLPRDAVLVNVSRGDVVVDDALIAALKSGHLFAAGLDVFRGEPNIHPGYRDLPNVFLLPHLGSATVETRDAMGMLLLDGLRAFEAGERSANRID
jgi:glyoxylate reductase